jgi:FTR1 family protein
MVQAFFQALVITLREGFEAFLIVAISLAYLRKSGRARLIPAVHWGIAAAIGASLLGGYALFNAPNQELLDGPLAIVAAASVTWMIVHMWRAGRRMKGDIEGRLQLSSVKPGTAAFTGVFLFTVLMVSREGMESALLLMQISLIFDFRFHRLELIPHFGRQMVCRDGSVVTLEKLRHKFTKERNHMLDANFGALQQLGESLASRRK